MQTSLLRLPSVESAMGLKRSAVYDRIARGLFPAPVALGTTAVAWLSTEIEAMQAAYIRGASEADIRALVSELHEARGYRPDEAKQAKYRAIVAKRRAAQQQQAA